MSRALQNDRPHARAWIPFIALAFVGAFTVVNGLIREPQRVWANILVDSMFLIGLGLGGLVLLALLEVTGARWSLPIRQIPVSMAAVLPVAALGIIAVLLCAPTLYPGPDNDSVTVLHSPFQRFWLNRPLFLARAFVYLAIWIGFAMVLARGWRSRETPSGRPGKGIVRLSAAFLLVFSVTFWLASTDWIMSLEPAWASTIFGVYNFASLFLSALAAVVLLAAFLERYSALKIRINADILHDLGTLLFGFSSFWMYTWFCQYLIIWYVNIPEETSYFRRRVEGGWLPLMYIDISLNWAIPFAVLLFRRAKRNSLILGAMALVILAGRWVDLYVMVGPSQSSVTSTPGWAEAGIFAGAIGLFFLAVSLGLRKALPAYTLLAESQGR